MMYFSIAQEALFAVVLLHIVHKLLPLHVEASQGLKKQSSIL
jgi:hypothetical protein